MASENVVVTETELEITVSCMINASPADVWDAWTNPDKITYWWGPSGFTSTITEMDLIPGGRWKLIMHGPDGKEYPNEFTYEAVHEPKFLILTHHQSLEFNLRAWNIVVTFEKVGNKTKVTMSDRFKDEEEKAKHVNNFNAVAGAKETFTRLTTFFEQNLMEEII